MQPSKTLEPILMTFCGISIFFNAEQFLNAEFPIILKPLGSETLSSE